jgi:hypothetical protein
LITDECFESQLLKLRERNNDHSFWVLFDILWAAEEALIRNPEIVVANKYATRLDLQNVEEACLKAVLLGWPSGYYSSDAEEPDRTQDRALQTYLDHFRDFLKHRNRKLLASQVEINVRKFGSLFSTTCVERVLLSFTRTPFAPEVVPTPPKFLRSQLRHFELGSD